MNRLFILLLPMLLFCSFASADIIPPEGVYQDFYAWTGIETTPGVILCESLSVCDQRNGQKVSTLLGAGGQHTLPVIEAWDGWAKVYYSDGNYVGWVRSDYLLMDPAWYLTNDDTYVYAYADTMAPKIALLEEGKKLPIILDEAEWVLVSLRNATGWIRKTPRDTAVNTWFSPDMIGNIQSATLSVTGNAITISDPQKLMTLQTLLTNTEDTGGKVAGCPFMAQLSLTLSDGATITMDLATDSCCVYRIDERDYRYARNLFDPNEGAPSNECLFDLFGIPTPVKYTE